MTCWRISPVFSRVVVRWRRNTCSIPDQSLANQAISIGATHDVSMLQSPMTFVPCLRFFPAPPIRAGISKQIGNILGQRRLIVLREQVRAAKALDLGT